MINNEIKDAVRNFETLLNEQLDRIKRIENVLPAKDFSKSDKIVIGVIDGDGIGKIIVPEAVRVLEYVLKDELLSGKVVLKKIEGLTIENRLKQKKAVPDETLCEIKKCDVILKGPTTTPNGGTLESANVCLRRELDLYANIRPVCVPKEGIDWIFFRENTEGEYVLGSCGVEIKGKLAVDFKVTTDCGTRRIARKAFEYARANHKKNVAIVTKANIMKKTDGKFSAICHEVALEYPEIKTEEWYIDIMTANLVNKEIRNKFEVFVLPNLYGDIITDEAAQIQGGIGTAGSANAGDNYALFEAIHGSAPRMIEEGIAEYASPKSIIRAAAMMLRHISMPDRAERIENALSVCDTEATGNKHGVTAHEFTDALIKLL